jgi:hypothetical protein
VTTGVTTSKSEQSAGFANSKDKVQDKVGRNLNKKTFVYQYLLSRLLNGSLKQKNLNYSPLRKAQPFVGGEPPTSLLPKQNRTSLLSNSALIKNQRFLNTNLSLRSLPFGREESASAKGDSNSLAGHNNTFTSFAAASLFIPKVKNGKLKDGQFGVHDVGKDQVRNFFPYRKSFLCYWLFPFVGFVFTLGQNGAIQNTNHTLNYTFNSNSAAPSPYPKGTKTVRGEATTAFRRKANKMIYNIPNKSSKQIEDALFLYKKLKEDFYNSFDSLNSSVFAYGKTNDALNTFTVSASSSSLAPFLSKGKEGNSNSLKDNDKLYQQCSLYLQSLENYLRLNTNLNELENSLKMALLDKEKFNKADITIKNNKLLSENISDFSRLTNEVVTLPSTTSAISLLRNSPFGKGGTGDSSRNATVQENYKPFLAKQLKKTFWYEIPYPYFTFINGYEGGKGSEKSSIYLDSSLYTFVSKEKTRKYLTFPHIKLEKGISYTFSNVAPFSTSSSAFFAEGEKGLVQNARFPKGALAPLPSCSEEMLKKLCFFNSVGKTKHLGLKSEDNTTSKFHLQLMVPFPPSLRAGQGAKRGRGCELSEGQSKPTHDALGKNSIWLFKTPVVLKKGALHLKKESFFKVHFCQSKSEVGGWPPTQENSSFLFSGKNNISPAKQGGSGFATYSDNLRRSWLLRIFKEDQSPTGLQGKQTPSDFLSTYSNANPISSYLKASVILDNYAKNKSMQSLFVISPALARSATEGSVVREGNKKQSFSSVELLKKFKTKKQSFFELDEFVSRFFANGEYDSFIETNLNLSTSFLFAPSPSSLTSKRAQQEPSLEVRLSGKGLRSKPLTNEDSKRNVRNPSLRFAQRSKAQNSEHSIVSSILSNSKELDQKKFEGIWTEFLKTVTKTHIKGNQESLKDFKEQSNISTKNGISILIKNEKSGKKLSKETLYKLLFDSLEKSFFSLAEGKESMQINDTVTFTEPGPSQRGNKRNNIQIKLSHPILMSACQRPSTAFLSNSSLSNFTKFNNNGLFDNTFKSLNSFEKEELEHSPFSPFFTFFAQRTRAERGPVQLTRRVLDAKEKQIAQGLAEFPLPLCGRGNKAFAALPSNKLQDLGGWSPTKESDDISNKNKIKDFTFTRNALTGFSIDNAKFKETPKEIQAPAFFANSFFASPSALSAEKRKAPVQKKFNKKLNINEYLQYSTFIKKYVADVKNVLLKSRFKESSDILSYKSKSVSGKPLTSLLQKRTLPPSQNPTLQEGEGEALFAPKVQLEPPLGVRLSSLGLRSKPLTAAQGAYTYSENARMEKLLRAYFSIKKGKGLASISSPSLNAGEAKNSKKVQDVSKYSPLFMKKNTLNVLKWTSRLKTKITNKFIEKNRILFLNNGHSTISFKQNKEELLQKTPFFYKNRSLVKLQGIEIVRQFNDVYKHKFSPRLLIKNRSFIINNRFISSNIKEKGISPLSRLRRRQSVGVVIKPSSYFLGEGKFESYLSKTFGFGFSKKLNNSKIISKSNFVKYDDITKLKQEEQMNEKLPSALSLTQLENNRISLKKWEYDKVDMALETKRKNTQKKRRRKKLKKETRRRKKRKRFYPRPNWIRYRLYLNFLKKRYDKNSKTYQNTFSFYKGSLHKSFPNEKGMSRSSLFLRKSEHSSKEFSKEEHNLALLRASPFTKGAKRGSETNPALREAREGLTNNRPYIVLKNKETYADSSFISLNPSKDNFTISRVVLGDFKRVLWKSYWLRSNLNPYLKRVKTYLTEIKESTQRWEFFRNVNNFVNFLGGFISPFSPFESSTELHQRFTQAKQSAQNTSALPSSSYSATVKGHENHNSLGFQDSDSQLGKLGFSRISIEMRQNLFENYMNFSKWEKSLYLSEYNRITYQRIQEFISQIRENFAAIQGSSEGMGRNVKGKSRSASSATHISHLNLQDNKREAVLSKRKSTDFWVKLGKTLMAESYAQSTLLKKSWLFKEPTLPQLRMYWAFSKTSYGSFKDFNKRKETWTVGKKREQTKYNKTKKISRDLSLKLQTFLNEQYELWTSWNSKFSFKNSLSPYLAEGRAPSAQNPTGFEALRSPREELDSFEKPAFAKGFTPKFEKGEFAFAKAKAKLAVRGIAPYRLQVKQEMDSPFWPLLFQNALKKARLKEEKSTFLFNKSFSNNKYKYENLNALTLHQYKKNIQLSATSRFNSPLTISPTPSAWSTKLTNKSSYWWSDALTAKGFMPLELSQLQFLNKMETSRSLINSESYLPSSQAFTSLSLPSFMSQTLRVTNRSEDVKGAKKTVTSLFDFETKAFKISALLFHFCSIISLISISQIRDLLKLYFLGISKIYKSSMGILGFSFDFFPSFALGERRKEITPSFGKGASGLNKIQKQHFFNTKKSNSFSAFPPSLRTGQGAVSPATRTVLQATQKTKRSNQANQAKRQINSLQFLNKVNSLIRKSFTLHSTSTLPVKANKEISNLQTYNQLSKDASWTPSSISPPFFGKAVKEARTISLNYQKSSPYTNAKEFKTLSHSLPYAKRGRDRTSFFKTYTTLYSLILINYLLENLNGFSFKTNRLFKQTFDIFGRFGPRSLFNFLEKPGELIGDWIAYMFLVEWASDMTNTIPENVDVYLGTTTLKATRTLHGVNLLSIYQNLLVQKSSLLLFDMQSFVKNVSILNIGSTFIQRRIYHLYEILLQRFYQPDTDLIVRQKKGVIFWDIWGDFLMQVAEDSNINISELTSLKEEQIKLFEKAQESFTIESPKTDYFALHAPMRVAQPSQRQGVQEGSALFKSPLAALLAARRQSLASQDPQRGSATEGQGELRSNQRKVTTNDKKSFRFLKGVKGFKSFVPLLNKKDMSPKGFTALDKGSASFAPFPVRSKEVQAFSISTPYFSKAVKEGAKQSSIVVSKSFYTAKLFQAQQFLSYQGKDTELFIDLHPPKSFSMVSFLKRNESVQHPIGSLVCQIFSGIMSKQISKNILVVGPGSSIGRDGGAEKTLLIQAIAGETELKIITDNAYRYAMVNRGVAVGIKLLRDVFDSLALHTPCLFLIEDIHAIGERRPLLISDDENTKGAESNSFGSQREEIHEKNQVLYQLNKHVITHYRKPYKGDFSMLIPTNHFCFDLFRRNTGFAGNYPSKKQNFNFNAPRISIKSEKDQSNDSQMSSTSLSTHATVPSRLLVKSSQLFAPPATSPFSVLTLKEEKKFKPYKIVSEMPWGGLPGEQLAQVSKSSYSVRVKVALLADMAISTLSVKLDMITDLLVIIDSVKGNRGFVVFATTHVPYILDPALRRPGRLDETITLGLFPSILSRWEILQSSFGLFTAGKEQTGFNKGLSLDLTYSITFGHHPNRPSLFSNSAGGSVGASKNAEGNSFSKHIKQNNSSFAEGELTQFSNNIQKNLKIFISTSSSSHTLTANKAQAQNSSLTHTYSQTIANKLLPSRFYSRSASFPSLIFLNSSENVKKDRKIKKEIENINKIQTLPFPKGAKRGRAKRNIYSIFKMSNSSLPISNKRTSSYEGIKIDLSSNQEVARRISFGDSERRSAEFFGYPKDIQIMQQKQKALFDVNKILSQTYFYASLLLYEASINLKNSPQFLDTPSSLFVTNQTTPLSLYASLYASPQQFKAFIVNFISGKLGETLLFSGIRPASFVTQNKEAINGFNSTPSSPKVKSVGVYTSYGLSSTWKALSSLVISFVQKRFLYHSNLIVPKFLYFNNQSSLLESPSPPSSNILLPARRYENYKRSFSVFSGQQISKKVGIMDKIQTHQQQRLIKRLYGFPVQESFRSEVMENRSTSFSNASLMIGSFSSILQKPSSSNWFVKNRILMRHKNYLTNQWWNGQLSEHNAETTFLSDIDWRSTFVESIGDLILDFPDADQHYNPRNRRWLLTKGSYHNWFDFDKTIYSEIYSHFIFDSFVKAYYIYEQNREVLDFYAYYVLKNGLHNVLNEFSILKLYKRFGTLSKPTPPEKQV